MGSAIYQVGYQATPWPSAMGGGFMFEMEALSQAWNEVRGLALGRLAQEASHVDADAIVGVELRTGEHDWAENAIEYVVIGTAVRHDKRDRRADPVLTELSVADYAKLLSAGVEPLGVVAWSSVFFVGASYATQIDERLRQPGLHPKSGAARIHTRRLQRPRDGIARLTEQAARLGASGVIGVRIAHGIQRTTVGAGTYRGAG